MVDETGLNFRVFGHAARGPAIGFLRSSLYPTALLQADVGTRRPDLLRGVVLFIPSSWGFAFVRSWYKILYGSRMTMMRRKKIQWVGSSFEALLDFPAASRREAGFQLGRVQAGLDPESWKSFAEVGVGVRGIRIKDHSGIYRVMYVAKFPEAVFVLHCFQKTTQATAKRDKEIASARYRLVLNNRVEEPL